MTVQRLDLGLTAPAAGCGGDSCMCGSPAESAASSSTAVIAELAVDGMTCSHCVGAVSKELSALEGVSDVDIDLVAGGTSRVTVRGTTPVPSDVLRAAIDEAGYTLVD